MVSFAEGNSENAQRELRDSVNKSLYADGAEEMFEPPKKLKRRSKLGTAASAVMARTTLIHVFIHHAFSR